jgi:hypothetical protein
MTQNIDEDDDDKVVQLQCPVSVYRSMTDAVVIFQDQTGMMGMDVLTSDEAVKALIAALRKQLAERKEGRGRSR